MTIRQDLLDNFRQADVTYQDTLREAETLKAVRDDTVKAMNDAGATVRDIAAATDLSSGRVQQILARARDRDEG